MLDYSGIKQVVLKTPQDKINLNTYQRGFTLIELMVALVLGLLISAAVIQVYFVSTKTSVIQSAGSNIVDANIFGIQSIEEKIKLANLGLASNVTGSAMYGGVVVNTDKNLNGVKIDPNLAVSSALVTRNGGDTVGTGNQWTGISNTNKASDQLTIQYRAPQDTFDCEGQLALGPRAVDIGGVPTIIDGQIIIERYFLRDFQGKLALACDAGRYINETMDNYTQQGNPAKAITVFTGPNSIKKFGDAGQVLISNVDDFQVLLGVMTATGIRYVTSTFYTDTANNLINLPIVSIKVGLIARGSIAMPGTEEGKSVFNILGQTTTIKATESKKIIRRSYESHIMLRNARVL